MLPLFSHFFFQKSGPLVLSQTLPSSSIQCKTDNIFPNIPTEHLHASDSQRVLNTLIPMSLPPLSILSSLGGQGQAGDLTTVVEQLVRQVTPHKEHFTTPPTGRDSHSLPLHPQMTGPSLQSSSDRSAAAVLDTQIHHLSFLSQLFSLSTRISTLSWSRAVSASLICNK